MSNVMNINFSGASSTGKSTITKYCGEIYEEPYSLETMPAYLIQNSMRIEDITNETFLICSKMHSEDIEQKQKQARKYLFIDSGPLIFYLGNIYSFGRDFPVLKNMAIEFYKEQDSVFVCDNHIPFDTKQMRGDEGTKDILHNEVIKFLNDHGIDYTTLAGTVKERACVVNKTLWNIEKEKSMLLTQLNADEILPPLKLLGLAYLETHGLWSRKKSAVKRIIDTSEFLSQRSSLGNKVPDVSVIKGLRELQQKQILGPNFEITNQRLFMKSDLFSSSQGLGYVRNLTDKVSYQNSQISMLCDRALSRV